MASRNARDTHQLRQSLGVELMDDDRLREARRTYRLQDRGDGRGFATRLPPSFVFENGLGQGDEPDQILFNHDGLVVLDYGGDDGGEE